MSKRQLRPILIKYMELTLNIIFNQQQCLFWHLLTVAVDQLDTVIVVRIVAGGNHDTAVKVIHTGNISHRRGRSDMEQIGICTGSGQTSDQTVFEHIGAAARILADDDTSRVVIAVALTQRIVIPTYLLVQFPDR